MIDDSPHSYRGSGDGGRKPYKKDNYSHQKSYSGADSGSSRQRYPYSNSYTQKSNYSTPTDAKKSYYGRSSTGGSLKGASSSESLNKSPSDNLRGSGLTATSDFLVYSSMDLYEVGTQVGEGTYG
jgi:hypothetical protein